MYRSFILGIPKIITSNVNIYYIPLFSFRQRYIILIILNYRAQFKEVLFIEISNMLYLI